MMIEDYFARRGKVWDDTAVVPPDGSVENGRPLLGTANFDRVARFYEMLERFAFGNGLQRARVCFLHPVQKFRRALIVGEGNGRFLAELTRLNGATEIDCIELSAEMLRLARKRLLALAQASSTGSPFGSAPPLRAGSRPCSG